MRRDHGSPAEDKVAATRDYNRGYQTGQKNLAALARAVRKAEGKLTQIMVAGCTCNTKTPELTSHQERCHFRLAGEALELLQPSIPGGSANG